MLVKVPGYDVETSQYPGLALVDPCNLVTVTSHLASGKTPIRASFHRHELTHDNACIEGAYLPPRGADQVWLLARAIGKEEISTFDIKLEGRDDQ
ncbi:hypothetical protein J1614_002499 [Plenodomus biglobosus]|nr:hypothetical protein J1614_002499 [Plenodomus biglobosus]